MMRPCNQRPHKLRTGLLQHAEGDIKPAKVFHQRWAVVPHDHTFTKLSFIERWQAHPLPPLKVRPIHSMIIAAYCAYARSLLALYHRLTCSLASSMIVDTRTLPSRWRCNSALGSFLNTSRLSGGCTIDCLPDPSA